ncbi:MAG: endolytic transglycosylase MltG [Lachnospiraceae bacterium]|nr:endolytic transglycosylase MltG [Lachnospiraceae bacterium]
MKAENTALRIIGIVIRIALFGIAAMVVVRVAKIAYGYGYEIFAQTPVSSGTGYIVTVTVGEEDSVGDVARNLEEKGLIRDDLLFRLQEMFSDYHGKIAPGTYDLSTAMTPDEMLAVMSAKTVAGEETAEQEGNSEVGVSGEDY